MSSALRALAARDDVAAPYDFAEFQRRAAMRPAGRPRAAERVLRLAAVIAPLALLLVIAGVARYGVEPGDAAADRVAADMVSADFDAVDPGPALVRAGPAARVIDLEDRIAWLDTLMSDAPAAGLSAEERARLASGREALAGSLQRVRHAQALLAY